MDLQDTISYEKNQTLVGKTAKVLVDRREGEYYIGRTQADSPEVDDEVIIAVGKKKTPPIGEFCMVRITQAFEHDVMAELL